MKIIITTLALLVLAAVAKPAYATDDTAKTPYLDCVIKRLDKINKLPPREEMEMLDGTTIKIEPFKDMLPYRFYEWESEVKTIPSRGKTRIYHMPRSICSDDKAEFGDVAEIYEGGTGYFMGWAVRSGQLNKDGKELYYAIQFPPYLLRPRKKKEEKIDM